MVRIHKKRIIRLYLLIAFILIIIFSIFGYRSIGNNSKDLKASGRSAPDQLTLETALEEDTKTYFSNLYNYLKEDDPSNSNNPDTCIPQEQDNSLNNNQDSGTINETSEQSKETRIIAKVYYVDEQAQFLTSEYRIIDGEAKTDHIISAFNELIKGPNKSNAYNFIPDGTEIIDTAYEDSYAFLNLSKEFLDNKEDNELIDFLVINCIAATITSIPDIDGVVINIEGEKIDKYGSLDISRPIKNNEELLNNTS